MSLDDISSGGIEKEAFILTPDSPENFLPLSEPTFYILLSLAQGDKHGYAIMKDIRVLSQGKLALSTSTLYDALSRLLCQGLIARIEKEDTENHNLRPRKEYCLTPLGRKMLAAETRRMQALVAAAAQRLGRDDI